MNDKAQSSTTDEAMVLIGDLISCMDQWERANLNSVARAVVWLKQHDRPGLFLPVSVRDMMEAVSNAP